MRVRIGLLQPFHKRVGQAGEERQHAMDRRAAADRVGRVDHRLAVDIGGADQLQRVERDRAADREDDDLCRGGRVGEAGHFRGLVLARPVLELTRLARADRHRVAVFRNPAARVLPTTPEPMTPIFMLSSSAFGALTPRFRLIWGARGSPTSRVKAPPRLWNAAPRRDRRTRNRLRARTASRATTATVGAKQSGE